MRASDYSDMNPFMLAVEKSHSEVMKAMLKKDPDVVSLPMGCGSTAIHWALEEGYNRSAFFKVSLSHPNFVNSFHYTRLYHEANYCFKTWFYLLFVQLLLNTCRVSLRKMRMLCSLLKTFKETQLHIWWQPQGTLKFLR